LLRGVSAKRPSASAARRDRLLDKVVVLRRRSSSTPFLLSLMMTRHIGYQSPMLPKVQIIDARSELARGSNLRIFFRLEPGLARIKDGKLCC
jgi:hypothetical protein